MTNTARATPIANISGAGDPISSRSLRSVSASCWKRTRPIPKRKPDNPDTLIFTIMREPEQRVTALLNNEIQIAAVHSAATCCARA